MIKRTVQRRWNVSKVAQWRMEEREIVSKDQGHQCMVCMQDHHLVMVDGNEHIGEPFLLCDLCDEVYMRISDRMQVESKSQMKRLIILAHGKYCRG